MDSRTILGPGDGCEDSRAVSGSALTHVGQTCLTWHLGHGLQVSIFTFWNPGLAKSCTVPELLKCKCLKHRRDTLALLMNFASQ